MWFALHYITFVYPITPSVEQQWYMSQWLEGLAHVLPCGACRDNFSDNLTTSEYSRSRTVRSRQALSEFGWMLHARVGAQLRTDYTPPTFQDVRRMYRKLIHCPRRSQTHITVEPSSHTDRFDNPSEENVYSSDTLGPSRHECVLLPFTFVLNAIALNYAVERRGAYTTWIHCTERILVDLLGIPSTQIAGCISVSHSFTSRTQLVRSMNTLTRSVGGCVGTPEFYERFRATACSRTTPTDKGECTVSTKLVCTVGVTHGGTSRITVASGCGV